MFRASKFVKVLLIVSVLAMVTGVIYAKDFPVRPITINCGAAAGGSADLVNRLIASLMEKELGQRINVVNVLGASGGVAVNEVMSKPHNGYYWLGHANPMVTLSVLGASNYPVRDWQFFLVAGTPGILSVRTDSPYNTAEELFDAMRKQGDKFKMGAGPAGCPWHVQQALLANYAKLNYTFVPYQGSNPSILACLSGEVDAVLCGVSEQAEFLRAKKLKPIAVIQLKPSEIPGYGKVRSICDLVPEMKKDIEMIKQFNGFMLPNDTDPKALAIIEKAFKKALKTKTIKEYCEKNYMTLIGLSGKKAKEFALEQEKIFCWTLFDLGVVQNSPAKFDIPRP